MKRRRQDQPQWALDIADRAMARLHKRYWRLLDRGKPPGVVVMAVARELAGFIGSAVRQYQWRQAQGDALKVGLARPQPPEGSAVLRVPCGR